MTVKIPSKLPGLNEYIRALDKNKHSGNALKRDTQNAVAFVLKTQIRRPLREPVVMHYTWIEANKRRDKDNVSSFGRKVIQDALVQIGALKNDGWANITGFSDSFRVGEPGVEIEIIESEVNADA